MSEYAKLQQSLPELENQRRSDAFETFARPVDDEAVDPERAATRFVELHRGAGPRDHAQLRADLSLLDQVIAFRFDDAALDVAEIEAYAAAACSTTGYCEAVAPSAATTAWLQGWTDRYVTWAYGGQSLSRPSVAPVVDHHALAERLRPALTPGAIAFLEAKALEDKLPFALGGEDVQPDAFVTAMVALDALARNREAAGFRRYGLGRLASVTRVYLSACAPDVGPRAALPPQCRESYARFAEDHATALMAPAVAGFIEIMDRTGFRATRQEVLDASQQSVREVAPRPKMRTPPASP